MFDIRGLRHSSPCLFPHIDVWGFCFWFCIRRRLRASSSLPAARLSLPPSLSPSLTHSLIHSLTHTLTHSCAFCMASVGQCALPRGRMYALASLGSPPLSRGSGTMCTAKGSDVRPGVPWVSASFAWQAWDNVHCPCQGSDVRPGVPWVSASFAWQAWDNVHCQGVGCTPWRPLGLRLFRVAGVGQCALPRGRSDVRPRPLGLRLFCVAGVGQCALPRGRMYALASLGSPPLLGVGVAQCALPRGRMYALASLGSPPLLRGRRGTICTAKGSDVRPGVPWVSASFAWQAWHNVHCGVAFAWQAWDTVLIFIHTHSFTFFTFTHFESLTHSLKSLLHSITHSHHSLNHIDR